MKRLTTILAVLSLSVSALAQQWKAAETGIATKWASEVNPDCPLAEYPRPQMVRSQWMNLNGLWDYAIGKASSVEFSPEGKILVPFAIESSLSGVGRRITKDDCIWYERIFDIPKKWKNDRIRLHFGAVDWESEVYINDKQVCRHRGGYDPFSIDITDFLAKSGPQKIKVKVLDASDNGFQPRGKQCSLSSGIWYTPVSGIWQTVWIEPVSETHIADYYTVSDIDSSRVSVYVTTAKARQGDIVKVKLLEGGIGYNPEHPSKKVIAQGSVQNGSVCLDIPQKNTWSPENPYLYGLEISVIRNKQTIDKVNGYTALRTVSKIKNPTTGYEKFGLNGKPQFFFGLLDQGYWPDGLYTAPTDEALKWDIEMTKKMGYNLIRKHMKVEPARWYYHCDVIGMTVWQDMPCIGDGSYPQQNTRDKEVREALENSWAPHGLEGGTECRIPSLWKENYYKEWASIIRSLRVFPCITSWIPFNESWGQFDTRTACRYTQSLDHTRLVNEASGGNFALCGDIIDVHNYPQPGLYFKVRGFINVLGEYGGIGYPVEGHTWEIKRKWGYGDVMTCSEELMAKYKEYAEILKYIIRESGCASAIYTQTTDVEGEVNGIITYDRKVVKVNIDDFAKINREVIEAAD